MTRVGLAPANWRKSSHSSQHGQCVEVAFLDQGTVAIRDSKNPAGPQLRFTTAEWSAFLAGAKNGEFDRA
jgi:hypothetical protein